jgi:hypothetical protein
LEWLEILISSFRFLQHPFLQNTKGPEVLKENITETLNIRKLKNEEKETFKESKNEAAPMSLSSRIKSIDKVSTHMKARKSTSESKLSLVLAKINSNGNKQQGQ